MDFDLLETVEYGGCSAKLAPSELAEALQGLSTVDDPRLLVDISTHDDAGVWKLSDDTALVQTTDFFPPVCSDPREFGQIAAANALSDVYAMGGRPLTALNLVMFPQQRIPLAVLREILRGGMDTVARAGAVVVGGHTIDDYPPKYGLAVTGVVHPDKLITNASAQPGRDLLLTKPLGTGVIAAGRRIGEVDPGAYRASLDTMKQLNAAAAAVMAENGVRCATDITGFGLLGHALKMADASGVSIEIHAGSVPLLDDAYRLVDLGCIPGASFRNQSFAEESCIVASSVDYNRKMLLFDAQTSGGILCAVDHDRTPDALAALHERGCPHAAVVGKVVPRKPKKLYIV